MQELVTLENKKINIQKFSIFTKIQASLGIFSILGMLLSTPNLSSQELIPELQMDGYDSQFMNQYYGQLYFQNNLTTWTNYVQSYVGTARGAWEASVDAVINSYVDSITTTDSFNTVEAYRDYVSKELMSQKSEALLDWESEANRHFLENQEAFVSKLNSSYVDSSYFSRIGQQSLYNQYLNNLAVTQNMQNQIAVSASNWQSTYNQNYQQGLNDFTNNLANITQQYESISNSIANNQTIFQQNLESINQYKTAVVGAIKGMLDNFQTDLDTGASCNLDGGCTYHQKGGALNSAGVLLKDFLDQMRPKVETVALDPSLFFTEISASFSTFLEAQKNIANAKYEFHEENTLTYQSSLGINFDTYRNYSEADINNLINSIRNGSFGTNPAYSTSAWEYEGHGGGIGGLFDPNAHNSTFAKIPDSDIRAMLGAIYNSIIHNGGDLSAVKSVLQGQLGSNYEVTNVLSANLYTDWAGGANGDGLAFWSITKQQGNLYNDRNAFAFWAGDRAIPPFVYYTQYFQMGQIQSGLLYEVKDKNQELLANHWDGTTSSLGNQLSLFADQISPAIANWEAQVQSYNEFYTAWQEEAVRLQADADTQYEQALANLEKEKTLWLNAMEKERIEGMAGWTDLYSQAGQMQTQADYVNFVSAANATVSTMSTGTVPTNASSIASKFDNAIDQLAERRFGVEPPQVSLAPMPSEEGKYYAGGSVGGGLAGNGIRSIQENFLKGTLDYVEGKVGSALGLASISPVSSSGGGSYSILGAASEKTVDVNLTIDGKDVYNHFQETANGV
ncbi:TIGR04388 family protein, partial [Leptospira sp. 96542]|nr:TIGR04388 family protein [Leptospira sp. 96542]